MTAVGHLELSLAAGPESVALARARVLDALPGLSADRADTVRLLISELVTNALRHSACGDPVELHATWNSCVRVEVVDHGQGFTPVPRDRPLEEPGGFGLFLVGSLADRWGVDTPDGADCTTVWFEVEGA
jgi:anti-sigma regulatory factor (Ser/Thr protein kinase)